MARRTQARNLPQTLTIKRDEAAPESMELVAGAILQIAEGIAKMRATARDKLIVLVLHDMTGISKRDIQRVLDVVPEIATTYLKKA